MTRINHSMSDNILKALNDISALQSKENKQITQDPATALTLENKLLCSPSNNIAVNIICKDEEKFIETCIRQASKLSNEIVVIDTGSTDNTLSILNKLISENIPINLFQMKWTNFADARNKALQCTMQTPGKKIIWLDADDYIPDESIEAILINNLDKENFAFSFTVKNLKAEGDSNDTNDFVQTRMFPCIHTIKWDRAVHESLLHSLNAHQIKIRSVPEISIYHLGYMEKDVLQKKAERNITLMSDNIFNKEIPVDELLSTLLHMGKSLILDNSKDKKLQGIGYLILALSKAEELPNTNPFEDYLLILLGHTYAEIGAYQVANYYLSRCDRSDALYVRATIAHRLGDLKTAYKLYSDFLVTTQGADHFHNEDKSFKEKAKLSIISILQSTEDLSVLESRKK